MASRPGSRAQVFLEKYLDVPLESEIASRTHMPARRHQIVEVG
jgi:hypothetical protein